jgi:hypothetical protein
MHPAVVGTHFLALLVYHFQEFCAVRVGFILRPSAVFSVSPIQGLGVKTLNMVTMIYLCKTVFDFFPRRMIREEPANGAALRALPAIVALIATESKNHQ